MEVVQSYAPVFFGATDNLAYKKIFPALRAMVQRRCLDVPVVGVAKSGRNIENLRARAPGEVHGGSRTFPRRSLLPHTGNIRRASSPSYSS